MLTELAPRFCVPSIGNGAASLNCAKQQICMRAKKLEGNYHVYIPGTFQILKKKLISRNICQMFVISGNIFFGAHMAVAISFEKNMVKVSLT